MIEVRPHHLLCLLGWRGHGYDKAFSDNFNRLADELKTAGVIRIIDGRDDICAACPKLENSDCRDGSPGDIDSRLLERLKISVDRVYEIAWLNSRIKKMVRSEDLNDICSGCSWLERGWCASALNGLSEPEGGTAAASRAAQVDIFDRTP